MSGLAIIEGLTYTESPASYCAGRGEGCLALEISFARFQPTYAVKSYVCHMLFSALLRVKELPCLRARAPFPATAHRLPLQSPWGV